MIDFAGNCKRLCLGTLLALGLALLAALLMPATVETAHTGGSDLSLHSAEPVDSWLLRATAIDLLGRPVTLHTETDRNGLRYTLHTQNLTSAKQLSAFADELRDRFGDTLHIVEVQSYATRLAARRTLVAAMAVALTALVLMLFFGIRYQANGGWSAAAASLAAQVNNGAWVLLAAWLFGLPLGSSTAAALIAALCCGLCMTILVFDRIVENRRLHGSKLTWAELVNRSIQQCLSRAVTAAFTMGLALLAILIFCYRQWLDAPVALVFPLLVGILAGLYSALCLAPGLWCLLHERGQKQPPSAQ